MASRDEVLVLQQEAAIERLQKRNNALAHQHKTNLKRGVEGLVAVGANAVGGYLEGRYEPEIKKLGYSPVGAVGFLLLGASLFTEGETSDLLMAAANGTLGGTAAVQMYKTGQETRAKADAKAKGTTTPTTTTPPAGTPAQTAAAR